MVTNFGDMVTFTKLEKFSKRGTLFFCPLKCQLHFKNVKILFNFFITLYH